MKASDKLKRLAEKARTIFDDEVKGGLVDDILTEIPKLIRIRTRLKKGVSSFGAKSSTLTDISNKYKNLRVRNKSNLSGETTAKRSNATATGQMLESIKGKRSGTRFTFEFVGSRGKELTGSSSKLSNSEVAKYYQDTKGRNFFTLSNTEIKNIQRLIRESLTDKIKKVLERL